MLFTPLGIETFEFSTNSMAHTDTARGLRLRPRDMAKFGQLFLNKGLWNGEQVIPEDWSSNPAQSS